MSFNPKDLRKITMKIPSKLNEIDADVLKIIECNEKTIEHYLERIIYTCKLSETDRNKLHIIYKETRKDILG